MTRAILYFVFLISVLLSGQCARAQAKKLSGEEIEKWQEIDTLLASLADSMINKAIPDDRMGLCVQFTKTLREVLDDPSSFYYPFEKLANAIHILYPPDKSFRIFNWMIAPNTTIRRYFGAIQLGGEEPVYYPMRDYSEDMGLQACNIVGNANQWFGCEYYKIMEQNVMGQKAYLLFGFSSNGWSSNKKLVDVLTFTERGPEFGMPIFNVPDLTGNNWEKCARFIIEYKKTTPAFLNFNEEKKMIVFDRLMSDINDPKRKNTYAPTGHTDGFKFENGQYIYVKDITPVLKLKDGQAPIDGVMQGG